MPDAFSHFEEQERSWSTLGALGPGLAREAAARRPLGSSEQLAGLVIERGAGEIRKRLESPPPEWEALGLDFVGVVERSLVETLLEGNGGKEVLGWMREHVADDQLPIVMFSQGGFQVLAQSMTS